VEKQQKTDKPFVKSMRVYGWKCLMLIRRIYSKTNNEPTFFKAVCSSFLSYTDLAIIVPTKKRALIKDLQ